MNKKILIPIITLLLLSLVSASILVEESDSASRYKELKEEIKDCHKSSLKASQNREECQKLLKDFRKSAKPHLINRVERQLSILQTLKSKVEASDIENKQELLDNIDKRIQKLKDMQEKIKKLQEEPANKELRDMALLLKNTIEDSQHDGRLASGHMLSNRISGIIIKAEKLETKLNRVLERLQASGQDTSKANQNLEDFKKNIELAKQKHKSALEKLKEAREKNNKELAREAHALLKEAHKNLQEANAELREFAKNVKNLKQGREELEKETKQDSEEK
ncbi:MAG TPA: hypothetical protein VJG30_02335 [Candidatus Nanoarchaeia archaeon]|nr:hypothetical protein [Candidatus Nanoarchaeia archaeon]